MVCRTIGKEGLKNGRGGISCSLNSQRAERSFTRSRPESNQRESKEMRKQMTHGVDLAEHELLELVVQGQDTSTGNTTEDVGTGTLEERADTLLGNDLRAGVHHRLVVDSATRGHHHTTTDSVKRVGGETGTGGDTPAESERGKEVALEGADEDDRLDRVVCRISGTSGEKRCSKLTHSKVETTVNNDTNDRGNEATVETGDTVRRKSLPVHIHETVELTLATLGGRLVVVGETGTGIVERVDEEKRRGTSSTTLRLSGNRSKAHASTLTEAMLPPNHFQ